MVLISNLGQRSLISTFSFYFIILLLFYYIQNLGIDGGGIDEPPLQLDENLHKNGKGSLKKKICSAEKCGREGDLKILEERCGEEEERRPPLKELLGSLDPG